MDKVVVPDTFKVLDKVVAPEMFTALDNVVGPPLVVKLLDKIVAPDTFRADAPTVASVALLNVTLQVDPNPKLLRAVFVFVNSDKLLALNNAFVPT